MEKSGIFWLADSGYSYFRLVTPNVNRSKAWNDAQKALRSVIETAIGMVKLFAFAAERVCVSPEIHELGLLLCYKLANKKLIQFPLRHPLLLTSAEGISLFQL